MALSTLLFLVIFSGTKHSIPYIISATKTNGGKTELKRKWSRRAKQNMRWARGELLSQQLQKGEDLIAGVGVWPGCERKYDLLMRRRETPELSEEEQQNGILPLRPHPPRFHFIFIYLAHHSSTCRHFLQCRTWLGHRQNLIIIQL